MSRDNPSGNKRLDGGAKPGAGAQSEANAQTVDNAPRLGPSPNSSPNQTRQSQVVAVGARSGSHDKSGVRQILSSDTTAREADLLGASGVGSFEEDQQALEQAQERVTRPIQAGGLRGSGGPGIALGGTLSGYAMSEKVSGRGRVPQGADPFAPEEETSRDGVSGARKVERPEASGSAKHTPAAASVAVVSPVLVSTSSVKPGTKTGLGAETIIGRAPFDLPPVEQGRHQGRTIQQANQPPTTGPVAPQPPQGPQMPQAPQDGGAGIRERVEMGQATLPAFSIKELLAPAAGIGSKSISPPGGQSGQAADGGRLVILDQEQDADLITRPVSGRMAFGSSTWQQAPNPFAAGARGLSLPADGSSGGTPQPPRADSSLSGISVWVDPRLAAEAAGGRSDRPGPVPGGEAEPSSAGESVSEDSLRVAGRARQSRRATWERMDTMLLSEGSGLQRRAGFRGWLADHIGALVISGIGMVVVVGVAFVATQQRDSAPQVGQAAQPMVGRSAQAHAGRVSGSSAAQGAMDVLPSSSDQHVSAGGAVTEVPLDPAQLKRAPQTMITSTPAGAELIHDGALVGHTPLLLSKKFAPGVYLVRKAGFEPELLQLDPEKPVAITVRLSPDADQAH